MRVRELVMVVLGSALLTHGCSTEQRGDGYGSASVAALTSSEVDRVEVTIDGTSFAETLSRDPVSGNFEPVVISDIPIGSYTFRAQAYDDDVVPAALLYEGTAPATITEAVQTAVTILLQQVPPADPFVNTVPIFQSLVYTPANPLTDEVVTLTVSVTDPDVGDVVTLLWSAPGGGALTPPLDQPSVDWTAPSTDGTYPVTITASDLSGATSTLTANIGVSLRLGSSEVTIDLNTWPEVSNLVPDPTRIDVGESTSLTLTATDPDGDDLAYAWSATGCAGNFSDATVANPDFTLTDAQGGTDCTLSVTITDVDTVTAIPRGGSNTADVTVATGPGIAATGLDCGGNFTCTLGAGSALTNYYVPTVFNPPSEVLPLTGTLEFECAPEDNSCACRAAFGGPIGPIAVPSLGNVCIFPEPIDFCDPGTITCEAGTEQNIDFIQRHNISSETVPGLPAPPRSCNDNAGCRSDCAQYCNGLAPANSYQRVENSPACEGFCRESDIPMCLPDDAVPDGRVECPPGDICDELEDFYEHDDFCGCQCVGTSNGAPTGAGQALLNIGFSYTVFLDSNGPPDWGVDGVPCTADDVPDAAVEPNCVPYTTSTATISLPDAGYYSAVVTSIPIDGNITAPPAVGAPFTCSDGVPISASGARLQGVTATKDSQRWDFASVFALECQ